MTPTVKKYSYQEHPYFQLYIFVSHCFCIYQTKTTHQSNVEEADQLITEIMTLYSLLVYFDYLDIEYCYESFTFKNLLHKLFNYLNLYPLEVVFC